MVKPISSKSLFNDAENLLGNDANTDSLALLTSSNNIDFLQIINISNGGQAGGSDTTSGTNSTSGSGSHDAAADGSSFAAGADAQAVLAAAQATVFGGTAPQQALKQLWTSADLPTDALFSQQWHLYNTGQNGAVKGVDIDVLPVWAMGYTGKGVAIGVFDTACDVKNTDLDGNVDLTKVITGAMVADHAFVDPTKIVSSALDSHSTSVSGIIAGERDGSGVVGIAYNAKFTPIDILGAQSGNYCWEAEQQEYRFDITNNSWGFTTPFAVNQLDPSAQYWVISSFTTAANTGRGGLGTIVNLAAGNYRQSGMTTELTGVTVDRHAIEIGACDDQGMVSYYSNGGASLLGVAPSSGTRTGITTDDVTGALGYSSGSTTNTFGGTSAATPEFSGVEALMLQANAKLGWRDVQDILALSERHIGTAINGGKSGYEQDSWSINHATNWNGGGMHFSNDYGFGLIDAAAAVRLAQTWGAVHSTAGVSSNEVAASASYSGAALDVGHGKTNVLTFNIGTHESVESMVLDLTNLKIDHANDLTMTLTSPGGTVSQLLTNNGGSSAIITSGWEFMSREFLGEDAFGKWTLTISDNKSTDIGSLSQAKLTAYGSAITNNAVEYYTDEFVTYANADASRLTLGSGITAIDAAAITGVCNVNLLTRTGSIDGKAISLGSAAINTVAGGGGDDLLVANNAGCRLYGGVGNDNEVGGTGNDVLDGGFGTNTITSGGGYDNIALHLRGVDNIVDFTTAFDHLVISRSEFTAFANGRALNSLDFVTVTNGNVSSTHVAGGGLVYDALHSDIYYDGDGRSALSLIAHLNNNAKLTTGDVTLVA